MSAQEDKPELQRWVVVAWKPRWKTQSSHFELPFASSQEENRAQEVLGGGRLLRTEKARVL